MVRLWRDFVGKKATKFLIWFNDVGLNDAQPFDIFPKSSRFLSEVSLKF